MKRLITAVCASILVSATPAMADGGHGYGYSKHESKHAEKAWKKERKAWEQQQKHWAKHGHHHAHVVNSYYYAAPPVVYYPQPAPVRYSQPPRLQVVLSLPLN